MEEKRRVYKVKTLEGQRREIVVRIEIYKAHHDENSFVPKQIFKYLESVDGKRYKKRCEVRVDGEDIMLIGSGKVQHLKRMDINRNVIKIVKAINEYGEMTNDRQSKVYLESIGVCK